MDAKVKAALLTSAKPILFNGDMVRAILEGIKTETRRIVKAPYYIDDEDVCRKSGTAMHEGVDHTHGMPYPDSLYHPGDILYVRETWVRLPVTPGDHFRPRGVYYYKADEDMRPERFRGNGWHPSTHMPKEAARIFLRVTGVRAERLQDITGEGCQNEGIAHIRMRRVDASTLCTYGADRFAALWDSTIKPAELDLYGWNENPWVWVIEFERIEVEKKQ